MPAVLVEVGFINSETDNQLFDRNFNEIAQGIASGILDTLNAMGDTPQQEYRVQVGAFRNKIYAERLFNELLEQEYPAFVQKGNDGIYRVQVGAYPTLTEVTKMEQKLKKAGYQTVVVS